MGKSFTEKKFTTMTMILLQNKNLLFFELNFENLLNMFQFSLLLILILIAMKYLIKSIAKQLLL